MNVPTMVTLYGKPGCHLCDEAEAALMELTAVYPHTVQKIDITQNADLHALYCHMIPVIMIGTAVLQAPIAPIQLKIALQEEAV